MQQFHLKVISPIKVFYEGDVESLIVYGKSGSFGILANHTSLFSILLPGDLIIKKSSKNIEKISLDQNNEYFQNNNKNEKKIDKAREVCYTRSSHNI
jgi:hypothetical protein